MLGRRPARRQWLWASGGFGPPEVSLPRGSLLWVESTLPRVSLRFPTHSPPLHTVVCVVLLLSLCHLFPVGTQLDTGVEQHPEGSQGYLLNGNWLKKKKNKNKKQLNTLWVLVAQRYGMNEAMQSPVLRGLTLSRKETATLREIAEQRGVRAPSPAPIRPWSSPGPPPSHLHL